MLYEKGEITLILVKEIKHGEVILQMLQELDVPSLMSSGGKRLRIAMNGDIHVSRGGPEEVKRLISSRTIRCVVGSVIFDEGVDIPALSAVILGGGGKSSIKTLQRAFRAMTIAEGKTRSWIFDFVDNTNYILRNHSRLRKSEYEKEDIKVVTNLPLVFTKKVGLLARRSRSR
jgi:superfamily II DNA or RNA helicase